MPSPYLSVALAVLGAAAATTTGVLLERYLRKRDERGDEPVKLTGMVIPPKMGIVGAAVTPGALARELTGIKLPPPKPEPPPEPPGRAPPQPKHRTPDGKLYGTGKDQPAAGAYWLDPQSEQQWLYTRGLTDDEEKAWGRDHDGGAWAPITRGALCPENLEGALSMTSKSVCAPTPMLPFGAQGHWNEKHKWVERLKKGKARRRCVFDPFFHGDVCYQSKKGYVK